MVKRPHIASFVLASALSLTTLHAADWFVSPTGTPTGNGSINNPWDLQTAFNHPASIQPGDTIFLRQGLYVGRFSSVLTGSVVLPIKVMPYNREEVILDGNSPMTDSKIILPFPAAGDEAGVHFDVTDASGIKIGRTIRIDDEVFNVNRIVGNRISAWRGECPQGVICNPPHPAGSQVFIQKSGATLDIGGSDTWYMNFEVRNSNPLRTTNTTGSNPWDMERGGIQVYGVRTKCINLISHDNAGGYGFKTEALEAEIYGSIVYNNGWDADDRGHGHGYYVQNKTSQKLIRESVFMNNFSGYGMHMYGSDQAFTNSFHIEGNIFYPAIQLFGGNTLARFLTLVDNMTYGGTIGVSYNNPWEDVFVANNYFGGRLAFKKSKRVVVTGNTFYNPSGTAIGQIMDYPGGNPWTDYSYTNNTYYHTGTNGAAAFWTPGVGYPFNTSDPIYNAQTNNVTWQSRGYDLNSSFNLNKAPDRIFIRRNQYDPSRAHVVIYNWSNSPTVNVVDNSGTLRAGDRYELRNMLNIYGDVITGTYNGQITIPMTGRPAPAKAIGWEPPINEQTFPTFGAFVLMNLTSGGPLVGSVGANQAPVVNAGADRAIPFGPARMQGALSDDLPNNPNLKAYWIKMSGPGAVTFEDYQSLTTGLTFSAQGRYSFRLTATDGLLGGDDFVNITVGDTPPPPDEPPPPTNSTIDFRFNPVINPANPTMEIPFNLVTADTVSMKVYNRSGSLVKTLFEGSLGAGPQKIIWDGKNSEGEKISSGTYFLKIKIGGNTTTRTVAAVQ